MRINNITPKNKNSITNQFQKPNQTRRLNQIKTTNNQYINQHENKKPRKLPKQNSNIAQNSTTLLNFKGGLKAPLTDEDYSSAKNYIDNYTKENKNTTYLSLLNLDKLEGIQKGIEVFEGLSIKDIEKILKYATLLLNRGCSSNCIHCAFNATPYSNLTQDRMAYEDFSSLINGIKELEKRTNNRVVIDRSLSDNLFRDSDCMDIELYDEIGNVYDYIDCIKEFDKLKFKQRPQFDTSGWNPESEMHNQRAQKLVDYLLSDDNRLETLYISVNPYHSIYAKSEEIKHPFQLKKAKELKEKYYKRIANAMFIFTPLLKTDEGDFDFKFLTRAIHPQNTNSTLNCNKLYSIKKGILKELKKMYEKDLKTEKKQIQSKKEIKELLEKYYYLIDGADEYASEKDNDLIEPFGRAETLFKNPNSTTKGREAKMLKYLQNPRFQVPFAINPDGSIIVIYNDISARTDLKLNFKHAQNPVKPFGKQVAGFKYIVNKE